MLNTASKMLDLVKVGGSEDQFLPPPSGPFRVGYCDVMTEGKPDQAVFIRLYYPTVQNYETLPERCPKWTDKETKDGLIDFVQGIVKRWPSWIDQTGFNAIGGIDPFRLLLHSPVLSRAVGPVMRVGWDILAINPRVPVIHQALPSGRDDSSTEWPVVIFSHGMGCNRTIYSQICYDLCSDGFVVAAVEHRDGSACGSRFFADGEMKEVPHRHLESSDQEYSLRSHQVQLRASEINRTRVLLESINVGMSPANMLEQEVGFSLELFKDLLDMKNVYLMGHSFGGASVLTAGSKEQEYKGIILLDPWMFSLQHQTLSVKSPVLMLNNDMFIHAKNVAKVKEVCEDLVEHVLHGSLHVVHTDLHHLFQNQVIKFCLGMRTSRESGIILEEHRTHIRTWIQDQENQRGSHRTRV